MDRRQTETHQTSDSFDSREWLTIRQAAVYVHVSVRSLYRAVRRRELRAAPVNARGDLRLSRRWLNDWLERRAE